eukprot:m.98706 g.98706  ORF g.98706 m.98706 type:complete len:340 (-) comp8866_c1_seq4:72-1091(-)
MRCETRMAEVASLPKQTTDLDKEIAALNEMISNLDAAIHEGKEKLNSMDLSSQAYTNTLALINVNLALLNRAEQKLARLQQQSAPGSGRAPTFSSAEVSIATPNELFDWLATREINGQAVVPCELERAPVKLEDSVDFNRVGRDEFLTAFFNLEKMHWKREGTGKQRNRLPAVHSPPGGGKSFICDMLASPDESVLALIRDDEQRTATKEKTFVLSITFNFHSRWNGLAAGVSASDELAIRFLHSCARPRRWEAHHLQLYALTLQLIAASASATKTWVILQISSSTASLSSLISGSSSSSSLRSCRRAARRASLSSSTRLSRPATSRRMARREIAAWRC